MPSKVKIGIIGTGQIGKAHLKRYAEVPNAEIVAVCDINETEARRVAGMYGIEKVFTNFRDLLAIEEIQSVDVCLHNNFHAPVSIAAMEAGKNVYCEKPLAGSYADAKAMIAARERTGKMLYMQQRVLFREETKAAKALIDAGMLGKIYYAKSSSYRRRGRPFVDGYGTATFVQKQNSAGGALYDMGIYHITQILHLIGNPKPLSVSGATYQETPMYEDRRQSSGYNVEELGVGLVRLEGGIAFFIEEAWAIHLGGTDGSKIAGAKGGVSLAPFAYHTTVADMEMDGAFSLGAAHKRWTSCIKDFDAYLGAEEHWVAAQQGRVPLIDTAALGLNMMLIAEGIFLSQKLGREVTPAEIEAASVSTAIQGL